jgi:hypothetical protein
VWIGTSAGRDAGLLSQSEEGAGVLGSLTGLEERPSLVAGKGSSPGRGSINFQS